MQVTTTYPSIIKYRGHRCKPRHWPFSTWYRPRPPWAMRRNQNRAVLVDSKTRSKDGASAQRDKTQRCARVCLYALSAVCTPPEHCPPHILRVLSTPSVSTHSTCWCVCARVGTQLHTAGLKARHEAETAVRSNTRCRSSSASNSLHSHLYALPAGAQAAVLGDVPLDAGTGIFVGVCPASLCTHGIQRR